MLTLCVVVNLSIGKLNRKGGDIEDISGTCKRGDVGAGGN